MKCKDCKKEERCKRHLIGKKNRKCLPGCRCGRHLAGRKRSTAISEANKRIWADPNQRLRRIRAISAAHRRLNRDPKVRARLSRQIKNAWKRNRQKFLDGFAKRPNQSQRSSERSIALWKDAAFRKKWSASRKKRIETDPKFLECLLRAAAKGSRAAFGCVRKNYKTKPEIHLHSLLDKLSPGEYKYVGDFSFFIGRKNPDFISRFKNKAVEMFGNYWHSPQDEKARIEYFRNRGFECLVVWESDLKSMVAEKKLRSFL